MEIKQIAQYDTKTRKNSKDTNRKAKSVGNTNPSGSGMNGNVFDSNYLCPTLTTNKGEGIKILKDNYAVELPEYRIRKLTPKECWRLMGFEDSDFEKAARVNSNSQLYKQAGNAIVVDVLEAIFKQMLLKE